MSQLKQIAEGYYNLLISGTPIASQQIEELARQRLSVCEQCPNLDKSGENCELKIHKKLNKPCCSLCGCFMEAKTRVLNASCPDKENPKW